MSASGDAMKYVLADAILALDYEAITPAAIQKTKEIILYHSWLSFFALKERDPEIEMAFAVARGLGLGEGPCSVIAHPFKTTPEQAAYLNCHLMRGAGYDDVVFPAGMHAALMVVPTAMVLAEQQRRTGRELLSAIVAGYEVLGHVGRWSWAEGTPRRPSTIFGPLAVTAVAGQLLKLNREQMATALGFAAHSAMGLAADLNTHLYGTLVRVGILSAFYGQANGKCPPDILEGKLGFYHTYFGAAPASAGDLLGAGWGKDHAVFMSREKRYPGTLLNTVAIEQLRKLVLAHGLNADNVEAVEVDLSNRRERHPTGQARPPYRTSSEASSACPFQMALLLVDGDLDFERYKRPNAPEIQAAIERISIRYVDRANPVYAKVTVRLRDGRVVSSEAEDHIWAPLDARVQLAKYAADALTTEQIDAYVSGVDALEATRDLPALFANLTPRG